MNSTELRRIVREEINNILNEDVIDLGLMKNGKSIPLSGIARIIRKDWVKVSPYAKPYLSAMSGLYDMEDSYGADSAENVVLYFLSNAGTWKGPIAKEVKLHLNKLVKGKIKID
jgi:hypothetical protein